MKPGQRAAWTAGVLVMLCGFARGQNGEVPAGSQPGAEQPETTQPGSDRPRRPGGLLSRPAGQGQPRVTGGAPVQPENVSPAGAAGEQPGEDGGEEGEGGPARELPAIDPTADEIEFTAFAEGVELKDLVEFVAQTLGIQVAVDPALTGTVAFTSGFTVPRGQLLALLNSLLEQQNYTIAPEAQGWYVVRSAAEVRARPLAGGELATTRLIRTPNLKPSSLQAAIETQLGARVGGGQAQAPGGAVATGLRIAYLDDLGVIVMTDTPSRVKVVVELVEAIVKEQMALNWVRFDLKYLAAPVARDRAIELVGGTGTARSAIRLPQGPGQQQQQPQAQAASGSGVETFADRLRVDPLGNALIFRGREDEMALVRQALEVIDQPSTLVSKRYFAGIDARAIANLASQRGLGEITYFDSGQTTQTPNFGGGGGGFNQQFQQQLAALSQQQSLQGGPLMVVDEYRGYIMYSGTSQQHEQMEALVAEFKPEDESITIGIYKLKHGDAQTVSDLLRAVVLGEDIVATGGLLPQNQGGGNQQNQQNRNQQNRNTGNRPPRALGSVGEGELGFTGDPALVEITADTENNQLVIKAPARSQRELERIISGIDIRRPQVYVDVKIVAISDSEATRLAFETQLINAQGAGGALQQNWGLTGVPTGGSFITPRTVAAGLPGFTGAVILSEYVPFVMTATEDVSDVKIVSNPTLLVDDNEEAEIISVRQEPTTTTNNIGNGQTTTTFQGYEDAGTTLLVTPRISAGGYMRLSYEITLSNFAGTGTNGIPPAKDERTIRADSVTIPGDATIVVGGIKIDDTRKTVARLPFIGEVPLLGMLFSDTRKSSSGSVLYVFITPRILSDRNFGGHRLLTEGPRRVADIAPDAPALEYAPIPMLPAVNPE